MTDISDLNYGVKVDSIVMEIVMSEAQEFINNEIELSTALNNAMRKLELYFAEQ